jgi:hypothetical protein
VCLVVLAPARARSQTTDAAIEATVVDVEKDDLVLDLGTRTGAADGAIVEIWRPLRLKHPVTGKIIVDRFVIGALRLTQVRPNLSLAKPEGVLSRPAEKGDVVVLAGAPAVAKAPSPAAAASLTATPTDDDARAVSDLFDTLRGADVVTRIHAYEKYIGERPHGPYTRVLSEEARELRKLVAPREAGAATRREQLADLSASTAPIDRVVAGEPLRIAMALRGPASGAVLHTRTMGDPTYSSEPMAKAGAEYWAATVPASSVQAPQLQWFVEAVAPDGTRSVVGAPDDPRTAVVDDVSPQRTREVLGEAKIWTDYASFNSRANNDYVWQTEGVMGARFDDKGIRAVRTGFGVYRGVGGTLGQLDQLGQPGTPAGLTYGYLEAEFGVARTLSLAARAIVGLKQDGVGGGASAFVRIGSDLETNLLLGGEVLGGIGLRGIAEFDWNSFRTWPIVLRSEVTNQPAGVGNDVGVRLIGQLGYRVLPHMVVAARASYQGRTIYHSGPGAGASVEYAW